MKLQSRILNLIAITMAVAAIAVIGSSLAAGRGVAGLPGPEFVIVSIPILPA